MTRLGQPEPSHQFPQFLPDGRHFLYYTLDAKPPGVYVGQLDGSETQRLLDADAAAVYVPSGYLLFLRQGTLFAQAFDPVRLALTGNPFRVAEQVGLGSVAGVVCVRHRHARLSRLVRRIRHDRDAAAGLVRPVRQGDSGGWSVRILELDRRLSPDGRQVA